MTRFPADRAEAETMLAAVSAFTRSQLDRAVAALAACHDELAAVLEGIPEGSPERDHLRELLGLARRYAGLLGGEIVDPNAYVPEPPAPVVRDLAREKDRLRQEVLAEAALRTQTSVELYQTVTALAAIPEVDRTPDQTLQLLQHASWAAEREAVETVRHAKVLEIDLLPDLDAVDAYDVRAGWPL